MKPIVSQRYDHFRGHWSFERNTGLPRHAFDRSPREKAAEWAALAVCALVLAGAIVLASYYL